MKIVTRIRFDEDENIFIVQRRYYLIFWRTAQKKDYGTKYNDREFTTYQKAREYAVKMATDVLLTHKLNEFKYVN